MKHKLLKMLIIFFIIFLTPIYSFADDFIEENNEDIFLQDETEKALNLYSKHAIVLERTTSRILFRKSAYEKTAMASTTKIMTCIVALENGNLNDIVTISENAAKITGSTLGLNKNSQITLHDLLYGLMLRSGNDCAIAVAEHISGSVENFLLLMNQKANELKLYNTHFTSPHGLDNEEHYTTAYELALLTNYALKNETFSKIVSTKTATITFNNVTCQISNTNELLGNTLGVYGVKTGFTFNAGRCLVSCCKRDNLDIIIVVLGADTKKIRTTDSLKLINYTFTNYSSYDLSNIIKSSFSNYLNILNNNIILYKTSTSPILELSETINAIVYISKTEQENLSSKIFISPSFSPDLVCHSQVGYLNIYIDTELLYTNKIILKNKLLPTTIKTYFFNAYKNIFNST